MANHLDIIDNLKKDIKANKDLEEEFTSFSNELSNTKIEVTTLCERSRIIENKSLQLKKQLETKNKELEEAIEERGKLKEKVDSLLDVLYGCPECGLHECECNDSVEEVNSISNPIITISTEQCEETSQLSLPCATSFEILSPCSRLSPWTPPPTPPCENCGGENFGPSPSSVCFACIPPLPTTSQPRRSSPSNTPPGTPPQLKTINSK